MDQVDGDQSLRTIPVSRPGASRLPPRSLPLLGKMHLAAEILLVYAQVRRTFRQGTLPYVVERLRTPRQRRRAPGILTGESSDGVRLGKALIRVLDPLPFDSRCLMRSLVLLRLLARRGTSGTLVIAVQRTEQPGLDAHAWVELDGRPLLAPGEGYGRLLTL